LSNVGSGGGAPAAAAAGGAGAAGGAAEETKEEEKKEEGPSPQMLHGTEEAGCVDMGLTCVMRNRKGGVRRRHGIRSLRLDWCGFRRLDDSIYSCLLSVLGLLHGWRRVLSDPTMRDTGNGGGIYWLAFGRSSYSCNAMIVHSYSPLRMTCTVIIRPS
jgi:hypothetical protein